MDIAVLNDLLSLKKSYPDRVHLILGNRDINKIRFLHELTCLKLHEHPGAYWTHSKPSEYIPKNSTSENSDSSDRVRILKWMLECTMGCPNTFNLRKKELERMNDNRSVSDDEVAYDFLKHVLPNGIMTEYLKLADLAVVIGDVLFLHGALTEHNFGVYPYHIDSKKTTPSSGEERAGGQHRSGGERHGEHGELSSSSSPSSSSSSSSSNRLSSRLLKEEHEQSLHLIYDWNKMNMCNGQVKEWVLKLKQFKEEQVKDFLKAGKVAESYLKNKWLS